MADPGTQPAQQERAHRLPGFVVIGAQKAGSTYLADRLGELDGVYVPRLEIPYFEAPFFENSSPEELSRAFADAAPTDQLGLKRADYLARPEVATNLDATVPDAKLIAVLRPPVERTVSAVHWYMLHGQLPRDGLNRNLRRILDAHIAGTLGGAEREIIVNSQYGSALANFATARREGRLVVVDSRRIDDDDTYAALAEPLGLPGSRWPAPPLASRSNAGVYNPHRLRLLRLRSHLVYDWRKDDTFVYRSHAAAYRPVRASIALLPKLIDRFVLEPFVDNEPEPLDATIRTALDELFNPEIERVKAEFGVDLTRQPAREVSG